ncbi:2',5'-phosphodiesterase 12 [Ischnura elegans]|uniref:2',5'-phosphodiesterase 12 n=1 Tax=Ischnura elegans TaxID=197161 RepID=UPI001ED8921F|nr:2',5'-phosphodiesterase 12 [Ischnura elegans]
MKIRTNIFSSFIQAINYIGRRKFAMECQRVATAYLRVEDAADKFQFSFNFCHKNVNRQFNFIRFKSETVQDFLNRVANNVGKVVEQKNKRKKKKLKPAHQSNTASAEDVSEEINVQLLKDGIPVPPELKCYETLGHDRLRLLVCDNLYDIEVNVPWVSSLVLPDSILAGFPIYPCKLDIEFAGREESIFEWFKSIDDKRNNFSWTKVGEGYFYTPLTSDIGMRLKVSCTPRRKDDEGITYKEGPVVEAISPTIVEAGPGRCPFEDRHGFTLERMKCPSFRVVTYNLLADTYVDSDYSRTILYPYCPPYALAINYRKQLFLKELMGYNADLICLQEVDSKVFEFDLTPVLGSIGFDGVFQRKGGVVEGLACFFHKSKFKLVKTCSVTLGREMESNPVFAEFHGSVKGSRHGHLLLTKMADLPTTLLVTILRVVECGSMTDHHVIIGGTHLYFHPMADSIRLLQTGMVLTYLEHIAQEISHEFGRKPTVLFCGDFNSTPDTGAYRLLTTGRVEVDDPTWDSIELLEGYADEAERIEKEMTEPNSKGITLSHSLSLNSAYQELPFTNFTSGFVGCLDYIFYSTDGDNPLRVEQVVPLPSEEEVTQNTALPSIVFPSDHLALVADLRWSTS